MSLLLLLKGTGEAPEESVVVFDPDYRPPLELDVEIETAEGAVFRLNADDLDAAQIPQGITFGTQRGDGFGTASFTLSRDILRDYPDINLLDTVRFVGRQGDIAYEGRIHSFPRTNDPEHQIQVSCVGWMTYLKSEPASDLIIDRRLSGWGGPSTQRQSVGLAAGYRYSNAMSAGFQDSGAKGPAVVLSFSRFDGTYTENEEAWLYAGGEDIGAFRASATRLVGSGDSDWLTLLRLSPDDVRSESDDSSDLNYGNTENASVVASKSGRKYALIQTQYGGAFTGDGNGVLALEYPRVIGDHGLTARGTEPEEGYYASDIIKYVVNRHAPKIDTSEVQENTFVLTQAAWHDTDATAYSILQQVNDLVLWETNVWEDRKLYFEPADLSSYDWVLSTDDPGVTVMWQGDSIENFANGVVVTYSDFFGHTYKLYPSDHPEIADESEDNPATRHGENLWTSVTMPWQGLEAEALQFGRAYLAEFNRPRRPGTYRLSGGHIRDAAGHWRQGWQVRTSQTLGILDHPQDFPRLIYATGWTQDGKSLDITVDAPPSTLDSVVARHAIALQARGLTG